MSHTVAGIVAFNPDPRRLGENIAALLPQIDRLLIVDNASAETSWIASVASNPTVTVIRNVDNRGISRALNQIMEWADAQSAEWALLLDQDSICDSQLVSRLIAETSTEIGQVVPTIVDRNLSPEIDDVDVVKDVDFAITSGALTSVAGWKTIQGYDESLFIDFVDFDFCLRLRQAGFRIVRQPSALLLHQIGDSRRHAGVIAYNHSAFRSYHMARDMLRYAYKHAHMPKALKVGGRGVPMTYVVLVRKAVIILLFEQHRLSRVNALARGAIAGTRRRAKA